MKEDYKIGMDCPIQPLFWVDYKIIDLNPRIREVGSLEDLENFYPKELGLGEEDFGLNMESLEDAAKSAHKEHIGF